LILADGSSLTPILSPVDAFRGDFPNISIERTVAFLSAGRMRIFCPAAMCPESICPTMIFLSLMV
jgi:hypothetical protein